MDLINAIFGQMKDLTAGQECARAALIFVYGFIAVRLIGRRVFGKWAALDIIVSIMVGSDLSRALTGGAPLWGTLGATSLLFALHWAFAQAAARWPALSHLIEGRAAVLAVKGKPDVPVLPRWSISDADVKEALRSQGVEDLAGADRLMLEPSGKISVLRTPA